MLMVRMNRLLVRVMLAVSLASLLVPVVDASARVERRVYAGGVGIVSLPLCWGTGSTSLLGVCFALQSDDASVWFEIREDVDLGSVVGTASFVDAAGAVIGSGTTFCDVSPSLPVPKGAVAVRVVLGPLPDAPAMLACTPGTATSGVVVATFT